MQVLMFEEDIDSYKNYSYKYHGKGEPINLPNKEKLKNYFLKEKMKMTKKSFLFIIIIILVKMKKINLEKLVNREKKRIVNLEKINLKLNSIIKILGNSLWNKYLLIILNNQ